MAERPALSIYLNIDLKRPWMLGEPAGEAIKPIYVMCVSLFVINHWRSSMYFISWSDLFSGNSLSLELSFQTLVTSCPFDVWLAIWLWLYHLVSARPSLSGSVSLHDTCCYAQKERLGAAEPFVILIGMHAETFTLFPKREAPHSKQGFVLVGLFLFVLVNRVHVNLDLSP